jgi:hypothetical protein
METSENKEYRFKKGNTIGSETRFKPGNTLSVKYKPEYADGLLKYFADRDDMSNPELPTLEGWAIDNKISIRSVNYWVKDEDKYPRFASAYAQALAIQKKKLALLGLIGQYNHKLVEFLLKNNHGMVEKVEQKVDQTVDGGISVKVSYFEE